MNTINTFYNPANNKAEKKIGINKTALLSWIAVLGIMLLFWSGVAVLYKKDYVPHAIAKIEHKEKKFLATHKTIQKKVFGFRNSIS